MDLQVSMPRTDAGQQKKRAERKGKVGAAAPGDETFETKTRILTTRGIANEWPSIKGSNPSQKQSFADVSATIACKGGKVRG